jgi:hypothetical protein
MCKPAILHEMLPVAASSSTYCSLLLSTASRYPFKTKPWVPDTPPHLCGVNGCAGAAAAAGNFLGFGVERLGNLGAGTIAIEAPAVVGAHQGPV